MNTSFQVVLALLPFAALFVAFLVFRLDALRASLVTWVVELAIVLVFYRMGAHKSMEASLYGILAMWAGFLVLYTGHIFGQSYRSTGLLEILLESVRTIFPRWDRRGQAVALVAIVGGFIGAFNGFATYPVTIPGLVDLGFDGLFACSSYLVYFSWTLPFNSLFIAPNISEAASHVPVVDIVHVAGLMSIPLIFLSLIGFLKVLKLSVWQWESQVLLWVVGGGNSLAAILFTQVWPNYYIFMLLAGAAFSLAGLSVYGCIARRRPQPSGVVSPPALSVPFASSRAARWAAYAPLILGMLIVAVTKIPRVAAALAHTRFRVVAWNYPPVNVHILNSPGTYIFITALVCYLFKRKPASAARDLASASRRSWRTLATLAVGSGTVYLMVDSGQIGLLGKVVASGGKFLYALLYPPVAFLGGLAFGQGLPGDFLFSHMQVGIAPQMRIPLAVLVGIVTVITMGPNNALKPTQIAYSSSLAEVKGRDGEIFRICLPWQILQLVTATALAVAFVMLWR